MAEMNGQGCLAGNSLAGTFLPLLRSCHAKSVWRFLKIAANAAKAFRKVRTQMNPKSEVE
jgi:hypothetical protein